MIEIKVKGLDGAAAFLANQQKQLRFATAVALTRTARAIKDAMPDVLERVLQRPTSFTKRGLYVRGATPALLVAEVGFMDRQASYLKYQIAGGTRAPGPRGIKLPGNIELNAFGNIPRGLIDKLKAAAESGKLSAAITKRLGVTGRRKGQPALQLFYGRPTGRGWVNAPMGIWRRIAGAHGAQGKLVPVIVFEDTPAHYRPRFNFQREAEQIVAREWDKQFAQAFAEALRTAR